MRLQVGKWGNSLAIRIPKAMAEAVSLAEGQDVELDVEGNHLLIKPVGKKYSLDELLASVTPDNIHQETDWGSPVGKEVW